MYFTFTYRISYSKLSGPKGYPKLSGPNAELTRSPIDLTQFLKWVTWEPKALQDLHILSKNYVRKFLIFSYSFILKCISDSLNSLVFYNTHKASPDMCVCQKKFVKQNGRREYTIVVNINQQGYRQTGLPNIITPTYEDS